MQLMSNQMLQCEHSLKDKAPWLLKVQKHDNKQNFDYSTINTAFIYLFIYYVRVIETYAWWIHSNSTINN